MRYLTYDEIWEKVNAYEMPPELLNYEWYAISRGGLIPAFMLSIKYKKRINFIDPATEKFTPLVNPKSPVLFIDDIYTRGVHLNICLSLLKPQEFSTLALIMDTRHYVPTYYIYHTWEFLILPWDAYDTTDLFGFDLDGTICYEIPWEKIGKVIENAYWLWRIISYFYIKPLFKPRGNFVIISARPEQDRALTEQWLKKHNIKPLKLILAPKIFENAQERAQWKAAMIKKYNVTMYVENEEYIVKYLSQFPNVFVWHFTGPHC